MHTANLDGSPAQSHLHGTPFIEGNLGFLSMLCRRKVSGVPTNSLTGEATIPEVRNVKVAREKVKSFMVLDFLRRNIWKL